VVLLAFLAVEARFLEKAAESKELGQKAVLASFEAEQVSFARTLVEENVDLVVSESLGQGLALGLENQDLKHYVNARLLGLFLAIEQDFLEGVEVRFSDESKSAVFLSENSSVFLAKAGSQSIEAEYCFTGGLEKSNYVKARIFGNGLEAEFRVPAGYCAKALVVP